jgi:hypothetical protein
MITVRIEEITAFTDPSPKHIGWSAFPETPSGPIILAGKPYVCVMGRWETIPVKADEQGNVEVKEAIFAIAVMTAENFEKTQASMNLVKGAPSMLEGLNRAPGMRMGPNGPIIDLGKKN